MPALETLKRFTVKGNLKSILGMAKECPPKKVLTLFFVLELTNRAQRYRCDIARDEVALAMPARLETKKPWLRTITLLPLF
ncbi:hypothetical protein NDU88_005312 [Pleurodeles waltl]|uniref:Uncharacterized protein n=1 Tax=Pleurodeles waltl TaxID=8319 RepID=A0AAV7QKC8_PLEWA|nr:hypothetical protein NDU88_005312 [Pleurodeles waltl]